MKTKIFFLAFLFICSVSLVAQVSQSTGDLRGQATTCGDLEALFTSSGASVHNLLYSEVNVSNSTSNTLSQTKGSPYLANTFEKSDIYQNGELLGTFYTRYNAHSQELEVKKTLLEEEEYRALIKDETIKAVFRDKEIQFASFIDDKGKKQNDYLISKTDGKKYRLYQRLEVQYVEGKKAQNSMVNDIPSRFVSSSSYYLKNLGTSIVSYLPTKKSKLLKLFKENDKIQLTNLIKKKGLNLKKESDLTMLLDFADTLDQEDYAIKGK